MRAFYAIQVSLTQTETPVRTEENREECRSKYFAMQTFRLRRKLRFVGVDGNGRF